MVLGSGMAGLAQARVLSKYFSSVKVLERDTIAPEWTDETAKHASEVSRATRPVEQGSVHYEHSST